MPKKDYVIVCDGEERMTFAAASDNAAKRRARRYLAGCGSSAERLTATVCRVIGDANQWLDEVATVTARPRAI